MIPRGASARLITLALLVLAAVLAWTPAHPQPAVDSLPDGETPLPVASGYVNDVAGIMDEPSRARLEAFLDQLEKKTGAEFAVLTVRSTAPLTPSEYKVKVFQAWGLGKKGEDNGVLMLVAVEEREVRFETGYGLEGTLPDGFQSRVFRHSIAPRFRENDYAGGITAGVLACAGRIAKEKGVSLVWNGEELRYDSAEGRPPLLVIIVILVIILFVIGPILSAGRRRRRGHPWWIGPGGMGGGGWGGGFGGRGGGWGGGFGGGGGGGSFGGFGGGSSGGGGGGGSW